MNEAVINDGTYKLLRFGEIIYLKEDQGIFIQVSTTPVVQLAQKKLVWKSYALSGFFGAKCSLPKKSFS